MEEYSYIEDLVMKYQKQFKDGCTSEELEQSKNAATELLVKFKPLFKKYLQLIQTAQIDFSDKEMKRFILTFIGDPVLKYALKCEKQTADVKRDICYKFHFIVETYGKLPKEDINTDLQMLLLQLAKRYKQMGRHFCAYTYNAYHYEVARHIKKFTKNPSNIWYRNCEYEDFMQQYEDKIVEESFEDRIYENSAGIPDLTWIIGSNCSEIFQELTPFERKIILKYYLEDYNDRQIAEEFGLHINTCNSRRRQAVAKLAQIMGVDEKDIKRSRKSGLHRAGK